MFTSGTQNDFRVNLYAYPIVLKSINYTRYDYDSYSSEDEKSSFFLYAPTDGDYTITVTSVTSTGYFSMPREVIFHFTEKDFSRPYDQRNTGREFVFRYHHGDAERFTIPDCKEGFGYELYILPKEGSETSLECYAYLSVCFDGYHDVGELTDMEVPATCGKEGTRYIGCKLCHMVTETQTIPALSHEMEDWQVIAEASCTQEGQIGSVCRHCGLQENVVSLGKAGHLPTLITTQKRSHAADGSYEIRCESCDALLSSGAIHAESQHTPTLRIVKYASCDEGGAYELICRHCHVVLASGSTPTIDHHYIGSWSNENKRDFLEPDNWLLHASICSSCRDTRRFIFPSLVVLIVAAAVLIIAVVVLCIVLHKVRARRRYRIFLMNGGRITL